MKKLLVSVAFAALVAGSGSAFAAGNATGGSNLSFGLSYACTVNGATNPFNGNFDQTTKQILNPDLTVIPEVDLGSVVAQNLSVSCTGSGAYLSAKTQNGGITLNGVPANTNVPRIHYQANIVLNTITSVVLPATGTPGYKLSSGPISSGFSAATLTGTAKTLASPYPLQAGGYSDVLTIQVGDAL